jgi:hypothetical protein
MDVAGDKTYFLTLDDANVLSSAVADPIGCVRGLDRAVIDEVQRVRCEGFLDKYTPQKIVCGV